MQTKYQKLDAWLRNQKMERVTPQELWEIQQKLNLTESSSSKVHGTTKIRLAKKNGVELGWKYENGILTLE